MHWLLLASCGCCRHDGVSRLATTLPAYYYFISLSHSVPTHGKMETKRAKHRHLFSSSSSSPWSWSSSHSLSLTILVFPYFRIPALFLQTSHSFRFHAWVRKRKRKEEEEMESRMRKKKRLSANWQQTVSEWWHESCYLGREEEERGCKLYIFFLDISFFGNIYIIYPMHAGLPVQKMNANTEMYTVDKWSFTTV